MNFITFCDLWIIEHPIKSRLSSILWQIILILDVWNLSVEELSIVISNLALMIGAYNESRKE